MSYDEQDAAMDDFYDQMSKELYPEHKEQAIDEFIEERMRSYFLKYPEIINAPIECFGHAIECSDISPRSAVVMHTTAIELYLKSVLLKPVLYGMIHNENVAVLIVEATTKQSGLNRYNKLLSVLCDQAAGVNLSDIDELDWKSRFSEVEKTQKIRNKIVHQGYQATKKEAEQARNVVVSILTRMVEPVLKSLNLTIDESTPDHAIIISK